MASSRADLAVPVGFRFHPTEEEVVGYYLEWKIRGRDDLVSQVIREINFYNYEPWDLHAFSLIKSDDQEWFFFARLDYKQNRRDQINRATKTGFWKITGQERAIKARDKRTVIGKKRTMTFYRGRVRRSEKTNWVMQEYYIPGTNPNAEQRDFVLCRVKNKSVGNADVATCDEGEPSTHNESDFEIQPQPAFTMDVQEEYTRPQPNLEIFEQTRDLLLNAHNNNNYHELQLAFGDNEPHDGFLLDSVIVDPDQDSDEEITHTNVFNDATLPQSMRMVYREDGGLSSDTDTEVVHERVMRPQMLSELSFGRSQARQDQAVMPRNEISRLAASSVNVAPRPQTNRLQLLTEERPRIYEKPLPPPQRRFVNESRDASSVAADSNIVSINCMQLLTDDYYRNERTRRRTYPPTGKLFELQMQQSKGKDAAERRTSVDLARNKSSITVSSIDKKVAQGSTAEKGTKQTQNSTTSITKPSTDRKVAQGNNAEKGVKETQNRTAANWKGSFISWQTSPITSPQSVYIFNTVLGAILFVTFARELVVYGQWC